MSMRQPGACSLYREMYAEELHFGRLARYVKEGNNTVTGMVFSLLADRSML